GRAAPVAGDAGGAAEAVADTPSGRTSASTTRHRDLEERRGIVARRNLLLDQRSPALQVRVAHGAVEVHHRLLEALEQFKIHRAVVDLFEGADGNPLQDADPGDIRQRRHEPVDDIPEHVPHSEGLEEGQDQVGARLDAIESERLTEVFTTLFDVELLLRDVPE